MKKIKASVFLNLEKNVYNVPLYFLKTTIYNLHIKSEQMYDKGAEMMPPAPGLSNI